MSVTFKLRITGSDAAACWVTGGGPYPPEPPVSGLYTYRGVPATGYLDLGPTVEGGVRPGVKSAQLEAVDGRTYVWNVQANTVVEETGQMPTGNQVTEWIKAHPAQAAVVAVVLWIAFGTKQSARYTRRRKRQIKET